MCPGTHIPAPFKVHSGSPAKTSASTVTSSRELSTRGRSKFFFVSLQMKSAVVCAVVGHMGPRLPVTHLAADFTSFGWGTSHRDMNGAVQCAVIWGGGMVLGLSSQRCWCWLIHRILQGSPPANQPRSPCPLTLPTKFHTRSIRKLTQPHPHFSKQGCF